jgi:hypothetical protein
LRHGAEGRERSTLEEFTADEVFSQVQNRREAAAAAAERGNETKIYWYFSNQKMVSKCIEWRRGVGAGRTTFTALERCCSCAHSRRSARFLVYVPELIVVSVIVVAPVCIIHRLRFDIYHLSKPIASFCTPATARNN